MTLTNLSDENYDGTSTQPSATGTNSIAIGVGATAPAANTTVFNNFVGIGTQYTVPQGPSYALDIKGDSGTTSGSNTIKLSYGDNVNNWLLISDGSTGSTVQARNKGLTLATRHNDNISFTRNNINVGSFTSSGLNVVGSITAAGGTFTGDVTFTGDTYNVLWDKSTDDFVFDQGARLDFGGGANIYRDASGIFRITGPTASDTYFNFSNNLIFYRSGSAAAQMMISSGTQRFHAYGNITVGGTVDGVDIAQNIPATLGTAGQVLTVNAGATAGEWADAAGGAALYGANESSPTAQPSATGANAVAIGDSATAGGDESVAIGVGASASGARGFAFGSLATASGINSVALGRAADSSGLLSVALGFDATASSQYSTAIGVNSSGFSSQAVTGTSAMALGGSYASGTDSFAAAIANNTSTYGATGANSIAMGYQARATGDDSIAIGESSRSTGTYRPLAIGFNTYASQSYSTAVGSYAEATASNATALGSGAAASGSYSIAIGNANADAYYSVAIGQDANTNGIRGKFAFACGDFSASGDAQGGQFILRADTTDATATVLTTNNSTAGSDDQIVAATDTCITFSGTVVAMQNGAQSYGSWEVRGLLVNDGGTTTLPVFNISEIGSSGWKLNLYADNTNNALTVQVTGVAATNIRWVANIATAEVTYA